MDKVSLTEYAKKNLKEVHALSKEYNAKAQDHTMKLLNLVDKHAKEIRELRERGDDHYSVEVGDLLILCHELLIEAEKDNDSIMEACYSRYKKKLKELIKAQADE